MAMVTKHAFVRTSVRRGACWMDGLAGTVCGCKTDFSESMELEPWALFIVGILESPFRLQRPRCCRDRQ
jgi:hypothetical protein